MGIDQLNKLGRNGYQYKNPYVKEPDKGQEAILNADKKKDETQKEFQERGILAQNTYLMGRLQVMQKEIDALKFDIVSLLAIIDGETDGQFSMLSLREKYSGFRASAVHVLNRLLNKAELVEKQQLNINE